MGTLLQASTLLGDYVRGLLEAMLALAVVAGLAYAALRFLPRGKLFARSSKRLAVEESLRLDSKSSLLIVQVEGRRLLVATHNQAAATLLTELSPDAKSDGLSAVALEQSGDTWAAGTSSRPEGREA